MANLFCKDQTEQDVPLKQTLREKYLNARHNILLILVFTVINVVLLITNSNTYFLFSAYVPYMIVDLGMLLCGMYPIEYYGTEFASLEFLGKGVFVAIMVIVAVILALYLLCWIFSKEITGWMVTALVFFCVDTAIMLLLNGIVSDMIIDLIFHGWVIFSLGSGISAYNKLKKLPAEEEVPVEPIAPEQL